MKSAELPENELIRQASLESYSILNTLPEKEFDTITALAAFICQTPIALVSLIDRDRQWFKSHHGLDAEETPRDVAFCAHAILDPNRIFIVEDAGKDKRFFDNPLCTGDPHVVFYAGAPLVTSDGNALGTLCVIDQKPGSLSQDQMKALSALSDHVVAQMELRKKVHELEIIEQELQLKNRAISRYAHLISHDLRAPMRSISMLSDLVLDESRGSLSEDAQNGLILLQKKANHARELVDGILSNAIAGQMTFNPEVIQLEDFIDSLIDFCSPPHDIHIHKEIQIDSITADPTVLHQIVQNLLGNAIKYNDKPEGHIWVLLKGAGDKVVIEVKDNGPGISAAYHERIFGMLQTFAKSDRFGKKGTGIGLNTVKSLVENLNGRIELESIVGEGSTFRVILPRE